MDNQENIQNSITECLKEHEALDKKITSMLGEARYDQVLAQRMKKRKLELKDKILHLQAILCDDIIA